MSTQQLLLQAIDLKKHYPVKKGLFAPERLVKALDGVSFTLERGKTLAVVGESGCGKRWWSHTYSSAGSLAATAGS
jgi:dipeptide transport system ATP-binding protein